MAERIARSSLSRAERSELTGLLSVLAGLRLPREAVERALRSNPVIRDLLQESSFAEVLREAGKREMAQTILESRFGPLRPDELAALRGADEPMLRSLAAHVATDSREQLRAWLGLPPIAESGD